MISPSEANGSSETTRASWYALTTQTESAGLAFRSAAMVGRAVLAMELSSDAMPMAITSVVKAGTRRGPRRPSSWVVILIAGRFSIAAACGTWAWGRGWVALALALAWETHHIGRVPTVEAD